MVRILHQFLRTEVIIKYSQNFKKLSVVSKLLNLDTVKYSSIPEFFGSDFQK